MGSWTDTLPTGLAAGDGITDSALLGKILPLLTAITDPWTAYVPSWGATSAPSKGSGSIEGLYRRVGKSGECAFRIVGAADTGWGSGSYTFGLPSGWAFQVGAHVNLYGYALVFDSSATQYYIGTIGVVAGDTTKFRIRPNAQGNLSATSLVTLATGDEILAHISTELA